jgi:hypothetical protein
MEGDKVDSRVITRALRKSVRLLDRWPNKELLTAYNTMSLVPILFLILTLQTFGLCSILFHYLHVL